MQGFGRGNEQRNIHLPDTFRVHFDLWRDPRDPDELLESGLDAVSPSTPQVEDPPGLSLLEHCAVAGDRIVDMNEIPPSREIAHLDHRALLVPGYRPQLLGKCRQSKVRRLTRPADIERPDDRGIVISGEPLHCRLAHPIGTGRRQGALLGQRLILFGHQPIDLGTRCQNDSHPTGCVQQILAAEHVDLKVEVRSAPRLTNVAEPCQMDDTVGVR